MGKRKKKDTPAPERPKTDRRYTITDEQKAQVWTLRAEDKSLRQIAEAVGIAPESVRRVLNEEPERYEALVALKKEERARLHQQNENAAVKATGRLIETAERILLTPKAGKARKLSEEEESFLKHGSRWLSAIRLAGDGAVKSSQLLTGQATEIVGREGLLEDMTDEDLARRAIELNVVGDLPATIRAIADKLLEDEDG